MSHLPFLRTIIFPGDIVDHLLGRPLVIVVHQEPKLPLLGPEDHGLAFHAADHVEGRPGLSSKRHLQHIIRDALFDGLAQLPLDFKETIGWA
jgi:hypothetical protein